MNNTNPIVVTYGSCLEIGLEFFDVDGEPNDITEDTFGILGASSSVLKQAVFTKTDAANGKLQMFLPAEDARLLGMGNVNWFRLRRILPDGCEDNAPEIWINVR